MQGRKTVSRATATIALTLLPAFAAPFSVYRQAFAVAFDSAALRTSSPETKTDPKAPAKAEAKPSRAAPTKRSVTVEAAPDSAAGTGANVTYGMIEGFTHLLKNTPPGPGRNTLLLNRASAMNLYARKKHLESKQTTMPEGIKQFFQAAARDAELVLASPYKSDEQVDRAQQLLGYSAMYLEDSRKARESFMHVLQRNPAAKNAGSLALFVAEDLFDDGKYAEASQYYAQFMNRMNPQGQQLAKYKLAWCKINLGATVEAEELFFHLSQEDASGFAKDSLRDLAYLISHRKEPGPAITAREAQFTKLPEKIEFLNLMRINLEAQNLRADHARVVQRLLELERDPVKRLELMLSDLRTQPKQYADSAWATAFDRIEQQWRGSKLSATDPRVLELAPGLERELITLIKSFLDTYAGRTKTPDPSMTPAAITAHLKRQFRAFGDFLPASSQRATVLGLWLEVVVSASDWPGVLEATDAILRDQSLPPELTERACMDQITALQNLASPQKPELASRLAARLKEFVTRFPSSKQWLRIARLHAQTEITAGRHAETLPLLEKIHRQEPTADSYFRLQFSRFKAGQFAQVLDDPENAKFPAPEPRLADLWRESALSLAQGAKAKGDLPAYQQQVQKFLQLKPDAAKAQIAREDYFNTLLERPNPEPLLREFLALAPASRATVGLRPVRLKLWNWSVRNGRFAEALELVRDPQHADPELAYREAIALQAQGQAPAPELLRALSAANRAYSLGLLALLKPPAALAYFRAYPPQGASERELASLASRIAANAWDLPRTPEREKLLGRDFAFQRVPDLALLSSEKQLAKLKFPGPKTAESAYAKAIAPLVGSMRKLRAEVVQEIAGRDPAVQLRAVELARESEARVAQTLLLSPIPKSLTPEQVKQYRQGLAEAAGEFEKQASEFARIATALHEGIAKSKAERDAKFLPKPDLAKWHWPKALKEESAKPVLAALASGSAGNPLGALTLLDFVRDQGSAELAELKNEAEYARARTGILLSAADTEILRFYVLAELESAGRKELIEEWKSLCHISP